MKNRTFTKERKIDFGPSLSGEELEQLVARTLAVSRAVVKLAKQARGG